MASWSTKRKYTYFFVFIVFVVLAVGLPVFFLTYESPTCSDGKQNGSERGIDCGGSCTRLCPAEFLSPRVLWSYSMNVATGIYNALAYVENPNQSVKAKSLGYSFKLFDERGLLVSERKGKAFIPAGQKFAIFEGGIKTGERIPVKTTFEFNEGVEWERSVQLSGLRTLTIDLEQGTEPKAEAKVKNESVDRVFSSVDAFIVIYDEKDNRLAFSKTIIETLNPGEITTLYFTWPEAFSGKALRSEVIFVAK